MHDKAVCSKNWITKLNVLGYYGWQTLELVLKFCQNVFGAAIFLLIFTPFWNKYLWCSIKLTLAFNYIYIQYKTSVRFFERCFKAILEECPAILLYLGKTTSSIVVVPFVRFRLFFPKQRRISTYVRLFILSRLIIHKTYGWGS